MKMRIILGVLFLCLLFSTIVNCAKEKDKAKKKKNVLDLTDEDVEKIYEEWEKNDDDRDPEDDKPPGPPKGAPKLTLDDIKNYNNVDEVMKMSKKGRPMMIFVTVSGNPTKVETERITTLWQVSLANANLIVERYITDDDRAIFMVNDGSLSWDIKDFLIKQDRCKDVTIDSKVYPGKAASGETVKQADKDKKSDL